MSDMGQYVQDDHDTVAVQPFCLLSARKCRFMAMTSSDDGTLRTWDTWTVTQSSVIKPTLARPARTSVTACRYGQDGTLVGAGLMDGTLQLWDAKGEHLAP